MPDYRRGRPTVVPSGLTSSSASVTDDGSGTGSNIATVAERCVPDFPQAAMESNLHIGMSDPTVLRIDVPTQVQIVA